MKFHPDLTHPYHIVTPGSIQIEFIKIFFSFSFLLNPLSKVYPMGKFAVASFLTFWFPQMISFTIGYEEKRRAKDHEMRPYCPNTLCMPWQTECIY